VGWGLTAALGGAVYFINDRIGNLQNIEISSQSKTILQQEAEVKNLTSDLATVREQAAELALKAQNAERQISDTYDFNGTHRQTKGAEHMTSAGKETAVFKAMVDLQQGMRWAELLADCDI
jgi:hypothetical protein